jgi:hypothetical protein
LSIPGFEEAFREAKEQAEAGEIVPFKSIRTDV